MSSLNSIYSTIRVLLLLSVAALTAWSQTPRPDAASVAKVGKSLGVPSLYVATGPSSETDLDRLRDSIGKLPGVVKVEARAEFDAITVTIDGDGRSTQSLFAAVAKSAGFAMRPVTDRYYSAVGPNSEANLSRLRTALQNVYGVQEVALNERAGGAAVRILGVTEHGAVTAAGQTAGFELRALGSYVASGSSTKTDLARLRTAIEKVDGVEQVEMQGLIGGATLLIHGDVKEPTLVAAAKSKGFALWPLGAAAGPRIFKVDDAPSTADEQRLRQALQGVDDIGKVEIRTGSEGQQVAVAGGSARPDGIVAAASAEGFTLTPVQTIALPSLAPEAERSAPPDYDLRVIEQHANPGDPAPPFTLLSQDGKAKISLSDYLGKKPVVLIFGSCTCPPFRSYIPSLERLNETYKDRVAFLLVYTQEAHPGSILSIPTQDGGRELQVMPQTSTMQARMRNLREFASLMKFTMPAGIDNLDNAAKCAYGSFPIRLYIVGIDGKIAYKGAPGPTGFKVPELEAWLRENVK